jgi:hypothetical protein
VALWAVVVSIATPESACLCRFNLTHARYTARTIRRHMYVVCRAEDLAVVG